MPRTTDTITGAAFAVGWIVALAAGSLGVLAGCGNPSDPGASTQPLPADREPVVADDVIGPGFYDDSFVVPATAAVPLWTSPELRSPVVAPRAGVLAVFEDPAVALAAGRRVHAVLLQAAAARGGGDDIVENPFGSPSAPPATTPEVAFMREIGASEPTRGFGWLGADRASGPAVSVLGAVVTVGDLAFINADPAAANPLLEAFLVLGAIATIGELDWNDDRGAGANVACTAAEPVPTDGLLALADYLSVSWSYDVIAPWDGPIDEEAQRLRRSYRLFEERRRSAAQAMFDDPAQVARQVDELVRAGLDPAAAVRDAMEAEGSMDAALVDGIDPLVVGWFIDRQLPLDPAEAARERAVRRRERSELLGALGADPDASGYRNPLGYGAISGEWRIDLGSRPAVLQVTRFESNSLARTLPQLVAYLVSIGCADVTVDLVDLDDE